MKKEALKKLSLSRETLANLENAQLGRAKGAEDDVSGQVPCPDVICITYTGVYTC